MRKQREQFDPRAILAALEHNGVDYVLIGGLAQVIRGADITTASVDICPRFGAGNLDRLAAAADELAATKSDGGVVQLTEATVGEEPIISLSTGAGSLRIVGSPAGTPQGYLDLRRVATKEHLGHGVQPMVASVGDLARMASAFHRDRDLERLAQLRRIIELETDREHMVGVAEPGRKLSRNVSQTARQARR
jgi:hypothetical protein